MNNIIICELFKNIIIEQNKLFLKIIADKYNLDYQFLLDTYLKPEYYLPIILKNK
jgi:hypothetical protein